MKDMTICDSDTGTKYTVELAPLWIINLIVNHPTMWNLEDTSVSPEAVLERCKIELVARGLEGRL